MPQNPSIPSVPAITDSEWAVMAEFWRLGEGTVKDIMPVLEEHQAWKITTVQTLINRLVLKKALGRRKEGREFIYVPLVGESQVTHAASRTFVDRVFGGKLAPLLACFLEREECNPGELAELKKLIQQKEEQ